MSDLQGFFKNEAGRVTAVNNNIELFNMVQESHNHLQGCLGLVIKTFLSLSDKSVCMSVRVSLACIGTLL